MNKFGLKLVNCNCNGCVLDRDGYNDGGEDNDDEDNADNMKFTVFEV